MSYASAHPVLSALEQARAVLAHAASLLDDHNIEGLGGYDDVCQSLQRASESLKSTAIWYPVIASLRDRILVEHGGPKSPLHGWNLTEADSLLHQRAANELEALVVRDQMCSSVTEVQYRALVSVLQKCASLLRLPVDTIPTDVVKAVLIELAVHALEKSLNKVQEHD